MTRQRCAIGLIVFLSIISGIFGEKKLFEAHCNLTKPARNDATFPSFSNINSLTFIISHRITHELTTRAFAMFLKEIVDFHGDIYFDTYDKDHWKTALYEQNKYYEDDKSTDIYNFFELMETDSVINLGVWQTSEHRDYLPQFIQASSDTEGSQEGSYFLNPFKTYWEGNSISPDVFRHGLYVPANLLQNNEKISYKNFINGDGSYKKTIKTFNLQNEEHLRAFLENTISINIEKITHLNVTNGIYSPTHCISEPCAIVFTSHYIDNYFFIRIIDTLKLRMKLYFMGDKLKRTIYNLSKIIERNNLKKNFLVLHWTPSEIIDGRDKFSSVELPPCELYRELNQNISCKFDANTVTVMFSKQIFKDSPFLAEILSKVRFKSLKPLIQRYDEKFLKDNIDVLLTIKSGNLSHIGAHNETDLDKIYNSIACDYMQKESYYRGNEEIDRWFSYPDERTILIGGMYPNDNTGQEYDGIQTALKMIDEDLINLTQLEGFPPEIKVESKGNKIDCKPDESLKNFISHFSDKSKTIGVLGPACSEAIEPIAIISKHYKMTAITYSAEGISFADRSNYPYFFRTIGENTQYEDVFTKLFERLNWERIVGITEDGQKWTEYLTNMESNTKFKLFNSRVNGKKDYDKLLKELKETNRARIIICDIHDHLLMKPIMCTASKLGMTAENGFVWFLPAYISLKLNETKFQIDNNENCTEPLTRILDKHFALSYANFGNDNDTIASNITVKQWKENYLERRNATSISFADYAPFVYDTVWVYVKAIKELMKADPPVNETSRYWYLQNLDKKQTYDKISQIIENLSFTGVSGKIEFNKAGSRYTDINILQWQQNQFELVGIFKPTVIDRKLNDGKLILHSDSKLVKPISWHLDQIPDDGRESCVLNFIADGLGVECSSVNSAVFGTLCVLTILVCSGFSFLFWKHKYAKKLQESAQIMMNYGRVVNGIELSRWEIPRENVILNRRIGEGAFGTVYGGEALINEEDGWTPVAIKTLKAGATAEARLDFLAESEIMKRFEHKNIVKLLAVCLQKEPLYMMSEFMLYGDLKTFLLARRHLVDDKIHDDNNDISPKRLTLMALDVARGLSYLASLNFVHRDIACRNCLINAQRICKIGDFGMARSTSDNDYYRFTRKGMLPVRWMSPESIANGLFTHSSDVWAFGVFLYEVVTLGGFPFQGLTNNQVFDLVKSGSSVKIPSKCKPQLKALMSSCFNIDPKKRPGASTIVEFISSHPRMLSPCMMDVPKPNLDEQVNLLGTDTDDLEFDQLAERERSHTPAATINVDFLRTSASSSALQNQTFRLNQEFEYLDMKLPRRIAGTNGLYKEYPDLTATLPNGNYNPVEPLLLQRRPEISKSTLSLLKMYVPMCGGKNRNRSPPEECTTSI